MIVGRDRRNALCSYSAWTDATTFPVACSRTADYGLRTLDFEPYELNRLYELTLLVLRTMDYGL